MAIRLNSETQKRIEHRLRDGVYQSPDDVVQAALTLLERRDRKKGEDLVRVREKIAAGIEQLDRGEGLDGEKVFEELVFELDRHGTAT